MRASLAIVLCVFGCVSPLPELGENDEGLLHLKGGDKSAPTFVVSGMTLRATGAFAGAGNKDMKIVLDAHGMVSGSCLRENGGLWDSPVAVNMPTEVSATTNIAVEVTKNGWTPFDLQTPPPSLAYLGACTVSAMRFQSATITVWQADEITFTQTWSL